MRLKSRNRFKWAVGVTTAPRAKPTLERCLKSLRDAGWSEPRIYAEPGSELFVGIDEQLIRSRARRLGAWRNWRESLRELVAEIPDADAYVMVQDDTVFCRGVREFLDGVLWRRVLPNHEDGSGATSFCVDSIGVVSLYCPKPYAAGIGFNEVKRGWSLIGALAYVFTPESAKAILSDGYVRNFSGKRNIDSVVGRWASRAGKKVFYLSPSLAQHIGDTSTVWDRATVGGRRRSSNFVGMDFDARELILSEESGLLPRREFRIAFLTAYFNPCGWEIRKSNYVKFRERMRKLGCEVFVAELSFDGRWEVEEGGAEHVFRFHGDAGRSVLWQKERLLNCLLERLPAEYNAVAWIDAEILIYDDDFLDRLKAKLQTCNAVQLFETATTLPPHGDEPALVAKSVCVEGGGWSPGYGWAYRREVLDAAGGFFDAGVLGHGDQYIAVAAGCRIEQRKLLDSMTQGFRDRYEQWAAKFREKAEGVVGYLPINVRHLWHGKRGDRKWTERQETLREFDPTTDVMIGESGVWEWTDHALSTKTDMVRRVREYFEERREDLPAIPEFPRVDVNEYFDHVYCVNLDRRTDRWEQVQRRFNRWGIEVERFSAIEPDAGNEWLDKAKLGCTLSHLAVWNDAAAKGYRRILVFEDDVLFHREWDKWIGKIATRDWELLYLGASQYDWSKIKVEEGGWYKASKTCGTFAYALDCRIIPRLVEAVSPLRKIVDNCYMDLGLVCWPNVCIADVSESDLRDGRDPRKHSLAVRWMIEEYE